MVIITDALGNVVKSIPENVYQGSNNANSVVLIAPFASNLQISVAFRTPDGNLTEPQLMTRYEDLPQAYSQFNGWTISLEQAITQLYGQVQMQFRAYNTTQTIASFGCSFTVLKGVPPILPATPTQTIYEQILEALANLQADIDNGNLESKAILPYDSEFYYSFGAMVYEPQTNAIYQSLKPKNKGNVLTNTTYWQAIKLATAQSVEDLDTRVTNNEQDIVVLNEKTEQLDTRVTKNEQDISKLQDIKSQIAGVVKVTGEVQEIQYLGQTIKILNFTIPQASLSNFNAIYRFSLLYQGTPLTDVVGFRLIDNENHIIKLFSSTDNQYINIQPLNVLDRYKLIDIKDNDDVILGWDFIALTNQQDTQNYVTNLLSTADNLGDEYYTKAEVDNKILDITAIRIRNVDGNPINATIDTVQTVATNYIVTKLGRQPETYDGLFITLTDKDNDVVEYAYFGTTWVNVGINGADLSNYVNVSEKQTITGDKNFTGALQHNGLDVETKPVDETYTIASEMWRALSGNDPYKFMASVTAEYTISTKTEVGTINDQPALFANYGFVVGSVSNQTVIIFAVSKPTADVNLSVRFRG